MKTEKWPLCTTTTRYNKKHTIDCKWEQVSSFSLWDFLFCTHKNVSPDLGKKIVYNIVQEVTQKNCSKE